VGKQFIHSDVEEGKIKKTSPFREERKIPLVTLSKTDGKISGSIAKKALQSGNSLGSKGGGDWSGNWPGRAAREKSPHTRGNMREINPKVGEVDWLKTR